MRRTLARTAPVAAVLAAAVVVSGTTGAVAGKMITGKQIKDGSITSLDVKNGSLTGADLKNESVTGADVDNQSLGVLDTSTDLDTFEQRVGGFATVAGHDQDVANNQNGAVQLSCPDGTAVLGAFSWWTASTQGTQIKYVGLGQAEAYSPNTSGASDTLNLTLTCGHVVEPD